MQDSKEIQKNFYDKHFSSISSRSNDSFDSGSNYFIERFINSSISSFAKKVLEIGCGNGFLTHYLLKKPIQLTAIDISEKAIEGMQKQFSAEIGEGRLKLQCTDIIEFLKDSDVKYDVIIGSGILHHIEKKDWEKLFRFAYINLAPGGIFTCAPEPNAGGLYAIAWPFAKIFYRLFGMDYNWKVERGTFDMIPKNIKSALKNAGFVKPEIAAFQLIPHFRLKFLEYIDKKSIGSIKGKMSFYIIVKGKK